MNLNQAYANTAMPFVYSVKYLCGLQTTPSTNPPLEPPVKSGNYATAINIHNYHSDLVATAQKKVVVSDGIIGPITQIQLRPNEAINIDCSKITKSLPNVPGLFFEGFLEIASKVQLSVSAVYTSQGCTDSSTSPCSKLGEVAINVVPQNAFRDQ